MNKSISAVVVTSTSIERQQIVYDTETGLIVEAGNLGLSKCDYEYSDDCLLFAGLGDVHIHAREDVSGKNNYKEDFTTAAHSAINGGVIHCCDMPNNPVPPIDDESYLAKLALTANKPITYFLYAGIGPKTNPLSFRVPYKAYMGPSVGELYFKDHATLDSALSRYEGRDVSFHCEDPDILEQYKDYPTHFERRPVKAEVLATDQALELIKKFNLKGKLCHYSSGEGLKAIRAFRNQGHQVEIEVTPQHLYFCDEELTPEFKYWYQMNPPIRSRADRDEMLHAVINGEIEYLATDHAPHTVEEKKKGISGMPGLDTYGLALGWLIHRHKVDPKRMALMCAENPGAFVGRFLSSLQGKSSIYNAFGQGFGHVKSGYVASFTVLNMKKSSKISHHNIKTKVGWSPFNELELPCQIEAVFHFGSQK